VTDGQRPVQASPPALGGGQELRSRRRPESRFHLPNGADPRWLTRKLPRVPQSVEHHYVVNETGCGNGGLQAIRHALRWEVLPCEFGHGVGGCPTS